MLFLMNLFTKTIEFINFAKKSIMTTNLDYEKQLLLQANLRKSAVKFIKIANDLWYNHSIELIIFRNSILDKTPSEIIDLHKYAGDFVGKPISVYDTTQIAEVLLKQDLPPAKLDIGKLTHEYDRDSFEETDIHEFLNNRLKGIHQIETFEPRDVVLYGFGRIGRLLARQLMSKTGKGSQLRLRAVVVRGSLDEKVLKKRAALLKSDSVHGDFLGTIEVDHEYQSLLINGTRVNFISADSPDEIDYTEYGIDEAFIIDNTGAFRDEEALSLHLKAKGSSQVLLTAPGKGIPNIVHGVNHTDIQPKKEKIASAASCTTNAITPVLKVIEDRYGIEDGHLETIHAYTNDQNLVDNMHKKYRRGRAAALNMVITETGAGKAVAKALPELNNKFTSNAIRIPVPNGSLAILNLNLKNKTTQTEINQNLKRSALEGELVEQIKYSIDEELVSSDIVGATAPAIFDSHATQIHDNGTSAVVYVWYDNEFGYTNQVIRLTKYMAGVRRFKYY